VHFLEQNYRSTGTIIRAAAAVVKNNRMRTPKTLWTENPDGDPIKLFEAWGEGDEAEWVAEQIQKIRTKDKNADIGILYRTNAQSRAIEQGLIRRNIPYRIFGGLKFYERKEIKDVVAALRYISNTKDEVAKERLEKNLTKRRFAEFRNKVAALAIANAGVDETTTGVKTADADVIGDDSAPKTLAPLLAIKMFLEAFNYFDYLETNFINADEREENIAELVAFASEFSDLHELLERLSLLQAVDEIGSKPQEGKEVSLMTIHLAKGLEFDNVFIVGAAEGFLPHGRSLESEASIEEERRLMYVAMTRARKNLAISFYGIPSRFIGEIPEDCIEVISSAEPETEADAGSRSRPGARPGTQKNDDVFFDEGPSEENIVMWD
jgi:DNA helicase-2/ATP-dependent DNA helicase PcrA